MLPITLILMILLNQLNESFTTRLPLEVFEIPSTSGQVYNSNINSNINLNINSNKNININSNINSNSNSRINSITSSNSGSLNSNSGSSSSSSTSSTNSNSNIHHINNNNINYIKQKSVFNHHSEKRRSRQMLDMLQHSDEEQHQQLEQHLPRSHTTTRVLYQVGESEKDLPICAPNAVCSKIDLYETPWIERQCRCPDTPLSFMKLPYTINHRKEHHMNGHDKLQAYFEAEKSVQQKRLMDFEDNKLESGHFNKLMQKLGAVYQDELIFDQNDLQEIDQISNNAFQDHKSEFNNLHRNNFRTSINNKNHMRHMGGGGGGEGGQGHKAKDIPYIGGCPSSLGVEDGHTIADKTRHYKLCNPVHKLPVCRYFRDYTWTLSTSSEMNVTEQIVHCRCPRNSVTYLTKRVPLTGGRIGYTYLFACSPQTRLRCQRKEPCKLFTVRKRQEFLDEVNTNSLCQCPKGHRCPRHHTDSGVIAGESFIEDNIQTYSGYCMAND